MLVLLSLCISCSSDLENIPEDTTGDDLEDIFNDPDDDDGMDDDGMDDGGMDDDGGSDGATEFILQNVIYSRGDSGARFVDILAAPNGVVAACGTKNQDNIANIGEALFEGYTPEGDLLWSQSFEGIGNRFNALAQIGAEDFLAVGESVGGDSFAVRFNSTGDVVWQQTYPGNGEDFINDVIALDDGGALLLGDTMSTTGVGEGNNGSIDALVIRIDSAGNLVWSRVYGGSEREFFSAGVLTSNGDFIVTGETVSEDGDINMSSNGFNDVWIVRIDTDGNMLDQNILGSSGQDTSFNIISLQNGNYLLAANNGDIADGDVAEVDGGGDAWILEINDELALVQQASLGGTGIDAAQGLVQTNNGDIIFAGVAEFSNRDVAGTVVAFDIWVVRLSAALEILDQVTIGGSSSDSASGLVQLTDGRFAVSGVTSSMNRDFADRPEVTGRNFSDAVIVVLDAL